MGQRAGEDKRLASQTRIAPRFALLSEPQSRFAQLLHQLAVGRFAEKLDDAGGDFRADFRHLAELFHRSGGELVQRTEVLGEELGRALRSEERRVGKECRARGWREDEKNKSV